MKDNENFNELTRKQKIIKEVKSIGLIVIIVFACRSIFYEPYRIPSGSMIPTLMIGDFILVDKFAYGFKVPFSDYFGDPIYITEFKSPKRGDVVVFKFPKQPEINYIKRVVGIPGDKVEVIDNVVYVNGKSIDRKEIDGKEIMMDMDDKFKHYSFKFYENKVGKKKYISQVNGIYMGQRSTYPEVTVPKGKYFVMGDNRDHSSDSRYWGFVPKENIKGRALFVWFSMIIPLFDDHPFKFRPHRIGSTIK